MNRCGAAGAAEKERNTVSYREALAAGRHELEQAEVPDAPSDAWLLLEHVTGMTRSRFYLVQDEAVPEEDLRRYLVLIGQRCRRIPLQHLTGEAWFMGLPFAVSPDVLIPRADTETLAEAVLNIPGGTGGLSLLDLCTGSGCIAVSLAALGKFAGVTASDISEKALRVAERNAAANGQRIRLVRSDLFSELAGERYDIITANPPYIRRDEIPELMPEVRDHDPVLALDGGGDGLDFYRRLAAECPEHLNPGGHVFFEIGRDQGEAVLRLLEEAGFVRLTVLRDAGGRDRVVTGISAGS